MLMNFSQTYTSNVYGLVSMPYKNGNYFFLKYKVFCYFFSKELELSIVEIYINIFELSIFYLKSIFNHVLDCIP